MHRCDARARSPGLPMKWPINSRERSRSWRAQEMDESHLEPMRTRLRGVVKQHTELVQTAESLRNEAWEHEVVLAKLERLSERLRGRIARAWLKAYA